jgi:hypothetical protein
MFCSAFSEKAIMEFSGLVQMGNILALLVPDQKKERKFWVCPNVCKD